MKVAQISLPPITVWRHNDTKFKHNTDGLHYCHQAGVTFDTTHIILRIQVYSVTLS